MNPAARMALEAQDRARAAALARRPIFGVDPTSGNKPPMLYTVGVYALGVAVFATPFLMIWHITQGNWGKVLK